MFWFISIIAQGVLKRFRPNVLEALASGMRTIDFILETMEIKETFKQFIIIAGIG